ncbi:MAG TPA: MFS transporter [Anaeromyxobacteraceae bacterium]
MRLPWTRAEEPLPATFWWLWSGALVSALATFVFPFLALYLASRGFTAEQAGLVVSLFGAGTVVSGPLAGFVADRAGRRPTMLFALCATAAVAALLGALSSPAALAAAVFAFGLVSNAYRPAASATVADVVPPPGRARAYGLLYWAHNLGLAVSAAAGGALAAGGYGKLFVADAATTLLFAALVWRKVPETRPPSAPGSAEGRAARGYGAVLGDGVLVAFLLLHLGFVVVLFQFLVAAPIDMAAHGVSTAAYGRVLAVNGVLIVLLQPSLSRISGRFDAARVLALAAVLLGLGYGAFALCASAWQYAAATAVWTLGEILAFPTSAAVVAALAPADLRGRYQGLYGLSFGVAMLLSPILGSSALQRLGSRALWASCLGLSLAVAAGQLAVGGARRRRLAVGVAGAPSP